MSLLEVFHSVATGSRRKRELLTPLGLLIFGLTLVAVVVPGLRRILIAGSFSRNVQSLAIAQSKQNRALFRGSYGLAAIFYPVVGGDTYGVLR